MPSLCKVVINWWGWEGAPGYTNLYFRNVTPGTMSQAVVDNAITKVDAWKAAWATHLPNTVTVQTEDQVEEVNDETGALVRFWTGTPAAASTGSATGAYSNAAGFCVSWTTNVVRNNRRIRGRSFVVPIGSTGLDALGSLAPTPRTTWNTASAAMYAASGDARFVIWARPVPEKAGPPVVPAVDGASAEVVSHNILDKTAVLTSRRD